MSSIRKFRKHVHYVCGDLAAETLVASHYINGFKREDAYQIINKVAQLQSDTLSKCRFNFDKSKRDFTDNSAYRQARRSYFSNAYAKLHADFHAGVEAIVKDMNKALPTEAREANKVS